MRTISLRAVSVVIALPAAAAATGAAVVGDFTTRCSAVGVLLLCLVLNGCRWPTVAVSDLHWWRSPQWLPARVKLYRDLCVGATVLVPFVLMQPTFFGRGLYDTFATVALALMAAILLWVNYCLERVHLAVARQSHGYCGSCGYGLNADLECTECGYDPERHADRALATVQVRH